MRGAGASPWNSDFSTARASCRSSTATSTTASWTKSRSCKPPTRSGFKYTWATEHHFLTEYSHLSANEVFLGYLAAGDVEHPHRLGHLQHHAAGEPSGARRGAGRDARPSLRGSLRVRHGPRFVDDRAEGLRHQRPRPHARHVRRGGRPVPQDVEARGVPGLRRPVLLDAGAQRVAEAVLEAAPADVGRGGQSRRRSRRRRAWGSACCASRSAGRSR